MLKEIEEGSESRKNWMMITFKIAAAKHKRNSEFQFWTHENHAVLIYSTKFIEQKIDYIHNNPVRAGIVENPEEYIYSSAKNYAGEKGLIDIETINRVWKTVK